MFIVVSKVWKICSKTKEFPEINFLIGKRDEKSDTGFEKSELLELVMCLRRLDVVHASAGIFFSNHWVWYGGISFQLVSGPRTCWSYLFKNLFPTIPKHLQLFVFCVKCVFLNSQNLNIKIYIFVVCVDLQKPWLID